MTTIDDSVRAYASALEAGDELALAAIFGRVPDDETDAFLAALEAAGVTAPGAELDLEAVIDVGRPDGMSRGVVDQLVTITSGSFSGFVRARAADLGIGADTIVGHVDAAGGLDDEDLDVAYAYVSAVLRGDDADVEPTPTLVAALARLLDTPTGVLDEVARRRSNR